MTVNKPKSKGQFLNTASAVALCVLLTIFNPQEANACTNPAGSAGDQLYNADFNVMQYCDGTDWTAMRGGTSAISLVDADGDTLIQVEEGADDDTIRFDTAGAERMTIESDGRVGIGGAPFATTSLTSQIYGTPENWKNGVTGYAFTSGSSASYNGTVGVSGYAETSATGAGTTEAYGLFGKADGTNDTTTQYVYGMLGQTETFDADIGYALAARDSDASTGGTAYGLYIDMDDTDVTRYGVYQASDNINYFAGNLGIGTVTPASPLSVYGTSPELLLLERATNNNALIEYKNSTASIFAGMANGGTGWGVDSDNNLGTTPYILIDRVTGDISVNGSSPADGSGSGGQDLKFDVNGAIGSDYYCDGNGLNCFLPTDVGGAVGSANEVIDADGDTLIQVEEGADDDTIRFDTAGAERMTIESDGRVGIGGAPFATTSLTSQIYGTPENWKNGVTGYAFTSGSSASYNGTVGVSGYAETSATGAGTTEAYGLFGKADGTNDTTTQYVYGMLGQTETFDADIGYALAARDSDASTGGTAYGLYIDMDDTDVTRYGVYQASDNINYFAGNVGIGENTPLYKLHVVKEGSGQTSVFDTYGASSITNFRSANGTVAAPTAKLSGETIANLGFSGYGSTGFSSGANVAFKAIAAENFTDAAYGSHMGLYTTSTGTTSNAERMRITSDGNVGIGTETPAAKLDVNGTVDIGFTDSANAWQAININHDADSGGLLSFQDAGGDKFVGFSGFQGADNVKRLFVGGSGWDVHDINEVRFYTDPNSPTTGINGGIERMRIDSNGDIGIGDTTPDARLDVETASGLAIWGTTSGIGSTAVSGTSSAVTGFGTGVSGTANSIDGTGVLGIATVSGGDARAVQGTANSVGGYAGYFTNQADGSVSLYGFDDNPTGNGRGVFGQTGSDSGRGVHAWASNSTGTNYGLYAATSSASGYGAYITNLGGSGTALQIGAGVIDMTSEKIINLADPTVAQDAATKAYVDASNSGIIDATQVTTDGGLAGGFKWEDGVNSINSNDGAGNVQIRFGHDFSTGDERFTHGGGASLITSNIDATSGTALTFRASSNPGAGDNAAVTWGSSLVLSATAVDYNTLDIIDTGSIGIGQTPAAGVELDVLGDIEYSGTLTDVSDRRLKNNVVALHEKGSMLDLIAKVNPVSFTMKDDEEQKIEYGVIAQDLEEIFPDLVKTSEDEMKTKSVNYIGLIAPMIESIKELKSKNDTLRAQNEKILERLEALENQ